METARAQELQHNDVQDHLSYHMSNMSRITRNLSLRFLTRSDTNWAVQPQKMARGLKFQTWEEEGLYFLDIAKKKAVLLQFT